MKHGVQFVLVVLCCFLLSLGSISSTGVKGSTGATARTAMPSSDSDRDSQYNISSDSSPDLSSNLDQSANDGYLTVPDVLGQFDNLQIHGDPLAFHLGVGIDPPIDPCDQAHYQSIARFDGPDGIPYMILTRGYHKTKDPCFWDTNPGDWPGELLVIKMASRVDRDGERLRSNRLEKGILMGDTIPLNEEGNIEDVGVTSIRFNGQWVTPSPSNQGECWPQVDRGVQNLCWPPYTHPGSGQLVGDVLVVPLEMYCPTLYNGGYDECPGDVIHQGAIALIDVSAPESPGLLYFEDFYVEHPTIWGKGDGLGAVGVTYVPQGEHEKTTNGGRYLFIMTWGTANNVRFAWSNTNDLRTTTDLDLEPFTWDEEGQSFKENWRNWQMLNFVRDPEVQTDAPYGTLYLIAAEKNRNTGDDNIGLFSVDMDKLNSTSYQQAISFKKEKMLKLNYPDMGNLDAASGIYVSPSKQLILYTAPHDNDGPQYNNIGIIEMGEFRNIDVYHEGTTPRDTMCPWVELYWDDWGWTHRNGSLMMDYQDRNLDDWYDLREEGDPDWNNEVTSFRTYLAPGQLLRLYDDVNYNVVEEEFREIMGTGDVLVFPDLDAWYFDNWNDKTSSVKLFPFADPGGPYFGAVGSAISLTRANRCYEDGEAGVTFTWNVNSPACTFSDKNARQPTLTCDEEGIFTIDLTVSEGTDDSSTILTTVTVYVSQIFLPFTLMN